MQVPLSKPDIGDDEITEVVKTLKSGWLTTGPKVETLQSEFAETVGARHAVALNSCTAALHLGVVALGLGPGDAVLVPTLSFVSAAQVVWETGATPILVDCDPQTLSIDLADAEKKLAAIRERKFGDLRAVGIIPVHVGGYTPFPQELLRFAKTHGLWIVEDAAHAFPAATLNSDHTSWRQCGQGTADVTCFSFYANKTMTTGEGGMAVTDSPDLADRMRVLSLHGISRDAWRRAEADIEWDYRISAHGFKYNMSDIAAAIGIVQLRRSEEMRMKRQAVAEYYLSAFGDLEEIDLPLNPPDRKHAWHLFQIKLRLDRLMVDRDGFYQDLKNQGVQTSVHWRPLHLHPAYQRPLGWTPEQFPVASQVWETLLSLPIYSSMSHSESDHVVNVVRRLCHSHRISLTA